MTVRALKSANGAEKSARDSPSSSFLIGLRGKTSSKVALVRHFYKKETSSSFYCPTESTRT